MLFGNVLLFFEPQQSTVYIEHVSLIIFVRNAVRTPPSGATTTKPVWDKPDITRDTLPAAPPQHLHIPETCNHVADEQYTITARLLISVAITIWYRLSDSTFSPFHTRFADSFTGTVVATRAWGTRSCSYDTVGSESFFTRVTIDISAYPIASSCSIET